MLVKSLGTTSRRRRMYRLAVGERKKITAYSAECQVTVGVMRFGIGISRSSGAVKANKGVEKSCRQRRRTRGQRKGKKRSRGCHPRLSVTRPAQEPRSMPRTIKRTVRLFDYWGKKSKRLVNLAQNWGKVFEGRRSVKGDFGGFLEKEKCTEPIKILWHEHITRLSTIPRLGPMIRSQYYFRSFRTFLDSHTGHKEALNDFASLLGRLNDVGLKPDHNDEEDRRRLESFHKRIQKLSSKALRCPKCKLALIKPYCRSCKIRVKTEEAERKTKVTSGYSSPSNAASSTLEKGGRGRKPR